MFRRLTLLLATLLATTALASGTAEGEARTEAPAFSVLANATISCSAAWPSTTVGCWLERPILVVGPLELAISLDAQVVIGGSPVGLDAQTVLTGALADSHLAPYLIVAAYLESWSAWAEVRLPELSGIPVIGSPDWLRIGFTYRIPP